MFWGRVYYPGSGCYISPKSLNRSRDLSGAISDFDGSTSCRNTTSFHAVNVPVADLFCHKFVLSCNWKTISYSAHVINILLIMKMFLDQRRPYNKFTAWLNGEYLLDSTGSNNKVLLDSDLQRSMLSSSKNSCMIKYLMNSRLQDCLLNSPSARPISNLFQALVH